MQRDFPEIVNSSRLVDPPETYHHVLKWNNNKYFESKGYYVDSTFFKMFDYVWLEGQPKTALMNPYTVVLTKKVKEKLFGRQPALGESIQINNRYGNNRFTVSGVVDPVANKSHIQAHFYMAMNSGGIGEYVRNNDQWAGGNFIYGYIELHPSAKPKALEAKLAAFLQRYGGQQLKALGMEKVLTLQPVRDIHLRSNRPNQLEAAGNLRFLRILLLIGAVILLIACVNFMNLATAKSMKSSTEIGIRKTIGADRQAIIRQFYIESFFITGISFALAIGIVLIVLPFVPYFKDISIRSTDLYSPITLCGLAGVYALTALIAGSYPAIYLSGFQPMAVMKGYLQKGRAHNTIRKSLVVVQFAISIVMIISSIVVLNQLKFMQQKDLGFEARQKIIVPFRTGEARDQLQTYKNEAMQLSGVQQAAGARVYPGQFVAQDFGLYKSGENMDHAHIIKLVQADEDYLKTLSVPILSGRDFTPGDTSLQILINQTGLETFGISLDQAVGQRLFSEYRDEKYTYEIIGVVKDFHQRSLKEVIQPMMFEYRPTDRNFLADPRCYHDRK